jgi:hypothetical protein
MDQMLQSYIGQIQIGEEQTYKNLTAYPVFSDKQTASRAKPTNLPDSIRRSIPRPTDGRDSALAAEAAARSSEAFFFPSPTLASFWNRSTASRA